MAIISLFKHIGEVNYPSDFDLLDYLEKTRDGEWEDIVNQCRLIKDKEKRDEFKRTMPTATLSGRFSARNNSSLIQHSGIIAMDIDYVSEDLNVVKYKLSQDRFVYSVFTSTSGLGLRVLFLIDQNKHRESHIAIANYLHEKYGLNSDPSGIALSKPYCVSYDPYLYVCPEFVPEWCKYVKETVVKPLTDFVHTDEDFKNVLKQITGRGVNICDSYNDWMRVGFAIASQFGADGLDYFHAISMQSQKYKKTETDYQYKKCLNGSAGTKRSEISTFYYLAKINNVNITSDRTKKIVRMTKNGKRAGLKKEQIVANLKKFENIEGVDKVVEEVYENNINNDEEEESILYGLEMFISNNFSLKMNEVTGYLEHAGKPQYSADLNTIFISAKKILPKLDFPLMMRLLKSDFIETYNPFHSFLNSDGIAINLPATPEKVSKSYDSPLIDLLASTIKNEDPAYTQFFIRKWIVSIISAMHKVHSPLLLALVGPQLTGKTEWFRRLLPKELHNYYQQSKLDKGTDDELLMCENILILDDELSGKSKSDTIKLNGITSTEHFSLRRPYGDHNEKVLRYAVLCGTSNYPKSILNDPTGNRRIIVVDVEDINKELFNEIDKRDLFLEAFRLYKERFDWRVNLLDVSYLNINKEKYETIIKEREIIEKYLLPGDTSDDRMSTTEILVDMELMTRQKLNLSVLGRELEAMGFKRITTRLNVVQTLKKWCVMKLYKINSFDKPPF